MSTSSGRYAVPPEILKHKPRGSMVKKIHGGYYVYAMENVKNPVTGKWQTKTKEILGKINDEDISSTFGGNASTLITKWK